MNENLDLIKKHILLDEHEACYNLSYYTDELWFSEFSETRDEAYTNIVTWVKSMTMKDIVTYYGDRYHYLIK